MLFVDPTWRRVVASVSDRGVLVIEVLVAQRVHLDAEDGARAAEGQLQAEVAGPWDGQVEQLLSSFKSYKAVKVISAAEVYHIYSKCIFIYTIYVSMYLWQMYLWHMYRQMSQI